MKITKIEKKKRLYLVELDDSERLYVTEDTIVRFMLSKDRVVTEQELNTIKTFAQISYGKNLGLYYISFASRSKKQVADYLRQHDIDEQIIPTVLEELERDRWIDDLKLAQNMVSQQLLSGDKGPFVIRQKLKQKGLETHDIESALSEADFSQSCQRVTEKLIKKYQSKLTRKALETKLRQQLASKGFDSRDITNTLSQLSLEKNEDNEEDLLYAAIDKVYARYAKKYDGYQLNQRLTQHLARKGFDFSAIASALRDYED